MIASFVVRPTLINQIMGKQMQDDELVKEVHKIMNGDIGENFRITQDGILTMKVSLDYDGYGALIASFMVRPTLVDQIRSKQMQDDELVKKV